MKKGFTLIEIIISIGLILLISIPFVFMSLKPKTVDKEKFLKDLKTNVIVYLESNSEDIRVLKLKNDNKNQYLSISDLISEGLIDGKAINPYCDNRTMKESITIEGCNLIKVYKDEDYVLNVEYPTIYTPTDPYLFLKGEAKCEMYAPTKILEMNNYKMETIYYQYIENGVYWHHNCTEQYDVYLMDTEGNEIKLEDDFYTSYVWSDAFTNDTQYDLEITLTKKGREKFDNEDKVSSITERITNIDNNAPIIIDASDWGNLKIIDDDYKMDLDYYSEEFISNYCGSYSGCIEDIDNLNTFKKLKDNVNNTFYEFDSLDGLTELRLDNYIDYAFNNLINSTDYQSDAKYCSKNTSMRFIAANEIDGSVYTNYYDININVCEYVPIYLNEIQTYFSSNCTLGVILDTIECIDGKGTLTDCNAMNSSIYYNSNYHCISSNHDYKTDKYDGSCYKNLIYNDRGQIISSEISPYGIYASYNSFSGSQDLALRLYFPYKELYIEEDISIFCTGEDPYIEPEPEPEEEPEYEDHDPCQGDPYCTW